MKKRILRLTAILTVILLSAPAFAEVITKEGFGETVWDANPTPAPGLTGRNVVTGYYWLTDSIDKTLTSENGYWAAGADSSIRINTYCVGGANNTKPWTDTSSILHMVMTAPTRYGGAWDTMYFKGIDIKDYEFMELKFGWGKRYNGWVAFDSLSRGLKIEYRIDGGDWKMLDTTKLENPLGGDKWSLADELYIDEKGDMLDIMFTTYIHINQIGIDDVVLVGDYNPTGIKGMTNRDINVYPNPAVNELNINLRSISNAHYEIFTMDGLKVSAGILENKLETIDISYLTSGIYLINLKYNGTQKTFKFSK